MFKKHRSNKSRRHRSARVQNNAKGTSSSSMVTMVWSGGPDWLSSKAQIVALASAVPNACPGVTAPAGTTFFSPWANCCNAPTLAQAKSIPGTLILSIGGSNATGWTPMATIGTIAQWVSYFQNNVFNLGVHGIDWDLEGLPSNAEWTFVGELTKALKQADPTLLFTFTIMGNVNNAEFPPESSGFLQTYGYLCDHLVFMLYGLGMWAEPSDGQAWCQFLDKTLESVPNNMLSKFLYALWPLGGTVDCCAACIQQAVDYIRVGKGAGVAFWCYGGWLGSCGTSKYQYTDPTTNITSTITSKMIVESWVEILNAGGGTGVSDFQSVHPGCTGYTLTNGCGFSNPPAQTTYQCFGSYCFPDTWGTLTSSNCNNTCSASSATYDCVSGACKLNTAGTGKYPTNTCNNDCGSTIQMYSCVSGACKQDPSGQYTYPQCTNACSNPQMYACDAGGCSMNAKGLYSSNAACEAACGSSALMYGCVNGSCQKTTGGTYTYKADCDKSCGTTSQTYDCVNGACQKNTTGTGQYPDSSCGNNCGTTYVCSTLGMIATNGYCADASQSFTCNGQQRCCCLGSTPQPSAVNPTSCGSSCSGSSCSGSSCNASALSAPVRVDRRSYYYTPNYYAYYY
jgi:hypothetical protein